MFKDLKTKLASQVTKTNQVLFSNVLSSDTDTARSRQDSASSEISQRNYQSPAQTHLPPSDIESEYGGDESDVERNPKVKQLLSIYKTKYLQLKKAYDEVEREKDHVKNLLQDYQDTAIARQTELREQLKTERKNKEHEIQQRDQLIEQLERSMVPQPDEEIIKQLCDKNEELEKSLEQYKAMLEAQTSSSNEFHQQVQEEHQKTLEETHRNKLREEVDHFKTINENQTRRIEQLIEEKTDNERLLMEQKEKIEELELTLKQTQESSAKLRKALQNLKETIAINGEKESADAAKLKTLTEEYEKRWKEQEMEYNQKLKAMAKEMSFQIDEKERDFQRQLNAHLQQHQKQEKDLQLDHDQRIHKAEQRANIAEAHLSKVQEQLKQIQLDHYRVVQDLQQQIEKLVKEQIQTKENFSQTSIEDPHSFSFEPTEIDYLKQILLAYMTGKDRLTMAKVLCAILRYTDEESSRILEHEKLRQSRWVKTPR